MTVSHADCDNPSKHVQIAAPLVVKEPLHVSLVDEDRVLVVGKEGRGQLAATHAARMLVTRALPSHKHTHCKHTQSRWTPTKR